ncbi:glycine zipper 2TM domain-containing protein [Trinickia dinghuensis]|uniref:Glycine zipper 2TM domain-containing protein n=1 Tax=Trinickia dinghuensis TaxID=2291023 RepID=A0A3D8JZX1_9BURK|nr:glycine zipper 2TM domain-containing protein [Trinickia dinghuensis]RDU97901.1 glycine zipper 2TM domain-containing protein [Trinickia dinghuensis]
MNNPTTSSRRLHPLIAVAAGTVIVASLAATAAITGVFPKASSSSVQTDQAQTSQVASQAVVDSAAPATAAAMTGQQQAQQQPSASAQATQQGEVAQRAPGQVQYTGQPGQPSYAQQPYGQQPPAQQQLAQQPYAQAQQPSGQSAYCASCGTVQSIVAVKHEGRGTGVGAVGGAVVGGLLGNQFGRGTGRLGMTALGAVGGGFAGNAVEKHLRSTTGYQVRVRMENGRLRYFTYRSAPPFQQGERVHIEHGTLAAG